MFAASHLIVTSWWCYGCNETPRCFIFMHDVARRWEVVWRTDILALSRSCPSEAIGSRKRWECELQKPRKMTASTKFKMSATFIALWLLLFLSVLTKSILPLLKSGYTVLVLLTLASTVNLVALFRAPHVPLLSFCFVRESVSRASYTIGWSLLIKLAFVVTDILLLYTVDLRLHTVLAVMYS